MDPAARHRFGPFELIPAERRLLRDGRPVPITPKVFETLLVLHTAAGRVVTKEDLIAAVWPDTFVDQNSLNKSISTLRKVVGRDYIETVPRLGYRFVAPVPHTAAQASPHRRTFVAAAIVLGIIGAVTAARWQSSQAPAIRSISVQPFRYLSNDSSQRYIANGIDEALANRLSAIDGITVQPASASVDASVRGAVQNDGRTIRITAEIFDRRREAIVWSHQLDVNPGDILMAEDILAQNIADHLRPGLTPEQRARLTRPRSRDGAAVQDYLRARDLLDRRASMGECEQILENAVIRDPQFALAWAALAEVRAVPWDGGAKDLAGARIAARRALRIDPSLAEAHATLGFIHFFYDWDWSAADRELRAAIGLNPGSARAHDWRAIVLAVKGNMTAARAELDRARTIDPRSIDIATDVALLDLLCRRYPAAERAARAVLARDPSSHLARGYLIGSLLHQHRFDEALAEDAATSTFTPLGPIRHAILRYNVGHMDERRHVLAMLNDTRVIAQGDPLLIASTYADLGERDRTLQWLERAYRNRSFGVVFLGVNPEFDPLRSDPRFQDLLRRIGLTTIHTSTVAMSAERDQLE